MSGQVPPSSRARLRASRAGVGLIERGASLYERFTGHDADEVTRVPRPAPLPRAVVAIGSLDGLLYTAERDGRLERYIHQFAKRDRPLLACSPNGRALYILGGRYRFTSLGIVDSSDRKHRNAR